MRESAKGYCRYCGKSSGLVKCHEAFCYENPNRKSQAGRIMTEEQKKKLSDIQKHYVAIGRNKGWMWSHSSKRSYPEQWFAKVIQNEFNDKEVIEQLRVGCYRLDFAWVHKMRCIEIDGLQHERDPIQAASDVRKDSFLTKSGWKILRVRWIDMLNDTKTLIQLAKSFIESGEIIPYEKRWEPKKPVYKPRKPKSIKVPKPKLTPEERLVKQVLMRERKKIQWQESMRQKYGDNPPRRSDGFINGHHVDESIWIKRKNEIDSYDKSSFGWMIRAIKETGLSKRIITSTCNHFGIEFRTTNHTSKNNWRSLRKDPASQLDLFYN
jgi:very-short-patch-repair endonuclease